MGSNEPLGTPSVADPNTHNSDTVVLDDDYQPASPGVGISAAPRPRDAADAVKKRKRYVFAEEDVGHMTFIVEVVKAVAEAITNVAPPDVHPVLYSAVMDASPTFSSEAMMVALSHFLENMAQWNGFVQMVENHMELYLRTFSGKHYYV
jgi:hypothetical protein